MTTGSPPISDNEGFAHRGPPTSGSGRLTDTDGGGRPVSELKGENLKNDRRCMRLFAVALLAVGIAATVIGILAIMGSSLPTVPFFQDIAAITSSIGAKLGTDAWTLSILTASLGLATMIGGAAWTAGECWIRKEKEHAKSTPAAEPVLLSDDGPTVVTLPLAPSHHERNRDGDGDGWE
ncbi:MAG: hypothetical protein KR126chlam2_00691 [Chlamydiae bacterium]|nr:hypothetical protein [Chlamydiota bacterium]